MRIEAVYEPTKFAINDLVFHNIDESVHHDINVDGFGHSNFSDIPLLIPIQVVNQAGDMDPNRAIELINDYTIAFFERYLKGDQETKVTELNRKYPEVE